MALLENLKKKLHHNLEFINKDILSVDETKLTKEKLMFLEICHTIYQQKS